MYILPFTTMSTILQSDFDGRTTLDDRRAKIAKSISPIG